MRWSDTMVLPNGAEHVDDAAVWMNYVYDPENAARITEYVGYISPVEGVQEILAAGRRRPAGARREPAAVPRRRHQRPAQRVRQPRRGRRGRVRRALLRDHRRLSGRRATPMAETTHAARTTAIVEAARRRRALRAADARGCCGWSLFFLVPLFTLVRTSLSAKQSRFAVDAGRSPGTSSNFTDALSRLRRRSSSGRSSTPASPRSSCIAHRLPAGVRHRVPGRALQEPAARPRRGAVLHVLPDPHDRLEDDPRPTRARVVAARPAQPRRRARALGITATAAARHTPAAVIGGLTYNFLPFMVLPIYVSLEKIDLRLVEAAKDLYSNGRRRVPQGRAPAVAARRVRRQPAHVHPRRR